MIRPEEIPQRVWDAALAATESPFPDDIKCIALAILAAEQREREACAAVADQYVWDDHALAQATPIGLAVHHQSLEIAEAIRNR